MLAQQKFNFLRNYAIFGCFYATQPGDLKKYQDKHVIITCKMGQHSGTAGTVLRKAGFEHVSRLRGGITEWRGQSLPVVKK